jgi:hypothetical protein
MWRVTPLTRRNSRTCLFSSLSAFKTWRYILSLYNLPLSALNFKETLIVVTKQRGINKAAINGVNKRIDNIINCNNFLVINLFPKGEIVKKQLCVNSNFINLRGRDLRCLNYRFVS